MGLLGFGHYLAADRADLLLFAEQGAAFWAYPDLAFCLSGKGSGLLHSCMGSSKLRSVSRRLSLRLLQRDAAIRAESALIWNEVCAVLAFHDSYPPLFCKMKSRPVIGNVSKDGSPGILRFLC